LVSFDVKSLFTKIPLDLAMEAVTEAVEEDEEISTRTTLNKKDII
jgi:hypothetical protein